MNTKAVNGVKGKGKFKPRKMKKTKKP